MHLDQAHQPLILPWLLDKIASAALHALNRKIDVAPRGHHDDGQTRVDLLNARQQIQALLPGGRIARVIQVDQQHVVLPLAQRLQGKLRRAHAVHVDSLGSQQQFHGFQNVRLIVRHQIRGF